MSGEHRHHCQNCGSEGLRTVALDCGQPGCGEEIVPHDSAITSDDLHEMAARDLTCPRCGITSLPMELLECPGCQDPQRATYPRETSPGAVTLQMNAEEVGGATGKNNIIIDEEIKQLIPVISDQERELLKASLRRDGCRDPLTIWQGILLDGHTRYGICNELNIPFQTREIALPDQEAVRLWVLENQLGRRNLTPEATSCLRGQIYNGMKCQGARNDLTSGQNARKSTAEDLAKTYGVDEKTIRRDAEYADQLDKLASTHGGRLRQEILTRKLKISKNTIPALLALDKIGQEKVIEAVRNGGRVSDHISRQMPSKREAAARSARTDTPSANAVPDKASTAHTSKTARSVPPSAGPPADRQQNELGAAEIIWSLGEVVRFLRNRSPGALTSGNMAQLADLYRQIGEELNRYRNGEPCRPSSEGGERE